MDCLAIVSSGNYAFKLCRVLERKGYVFEVVSVPCHIAKDGCGYCLKFPMQYMDLVMSVGRANGIIIREIYKIIRLLPTRNKYERIY